MATTVKVTGAKEVERVLLALATKEAKKIGRAAMRKAAKPILDAARSHVPVREGKLKRALRLRVDFGRFDKSVVLATVDIKHTGFRPRKSDRQSRVKGKLGPARFTYQIGSSPKVYGAFREWGIHGPMQPFMRPAWDAEGGPTAIERIGKELGEGIERAAGELRRS